MASWDAQQYLRFGDERTRPVRDLVGQIQLDSPQQVVDLGCGPGNSTSILAKRYPGARITGLDNSPEMLEAAATAMPGMDWALADIATWSATSAPDLIFSNAALHWLSDHEHLFPRLMGELAPGGCLAVQMPRNADEPVHQLLRTLAEEDQWAGKLASRRPLTRVGTPGFYYDLLAPLASRVEVWQTIYHHRMESPDQIVDWMRGSGLRPYLEALNPAEADAFQGLYRDGIAASYPAQQDGSRLLPFPRLFIVATRHGA